MAYTAKNNRNNELAIIHIAKKELGLDKDAYESVIRLISNGRTSSSSDLDYAERFKLIEHFKARGFKSKPATKSGTKVKLSMDEQHKMIRGLWLELFNLGAVINSSEQSILRFVKNQTKVDRMEWLTTMQASNCIEALKSWLAREQKKRAASNG